LRGTPLQATQDNNSSPIRIPQRRTTFRTVTIDAPHQQQGDHAIGANRRPLAVHQSGGLATGSRVHQVGLAGPGTGSFSESPRVHRLRARLTDPNTGQIPG